MLWHVAFTQKAALPNDVTEQTAVRTIVEFVNKPLNQRNLDMIAIRESQDPNKFPTRKLSAKA